MDSVNIGVAHLYYSRSLPGRSVAIARIASKPASPADLTDIANLELATPRKAGALTVTPYPDGLAVDAQALFNPIPIEGSLNYTLENQFFEITPDVDAHGLPL